MHLLVKLAAIGCCLEAGIGPRLILSDSAVNELLQLEHRRWCAERLLQGWRGGAIRDNRARIHPNLVPFAELDHETQLKDHDAVTAIPHFLASINMHGERKVAP